MNSRPIGDLSKISNPMKMSMLLKLCELMSIRISNNHNDADQGLYVMVEFSTHFWLWLRVSDLFNFQMKHLQLDISIKPTSKHMCHVVTLFFSKTIQELDK